MTATLNHPETNDLPLTRMATSRGSNHPASHDALDAQVRHAGRANASLPTNEGALTIGVPSAGSQATEGQRCGENHQAAALGSTSTSGQSPRATQLGSVSGGSNVGSSQPPCATQSRPAAADQATPPSHAPGDAHNHAAGRGPILDDPLLAIMADAVDDLERTRIASENRYRQLTRSELDKDGEERGFGLDDSVPEVARVKQIVDGLAALEHQAILGMNRQVRKHPLWKAWAINQKGIGEKQFARLLAAVGDPYWNDLHDRARTVSELWAYAGYHVVHPGGQLVRDPHRLIAAGVAPKRQRGQKSNWNETARMRVWNITGSCLKAQSHYADVYYEARDKYEGALHSAPCVRCGPKNNPAPEGSPLSAAHQHARGLRIMGKTILKDLWLASKALHS